VSPHASEHVVGLHGAGGEVMGELIRELVLPRFRVRAAGPVGLDALDDGAALIPPSGQLVITTDSHVVKPLFFPGGDIGRLAACGTVNDLAVMGARPWVCTLALVLEEGYPLDDLRTILTSCAEVLSELDVALVAGDTKVMGRGEVDGVVINTTGLGVAARVVSDAGLQSGDRIVVTGPVGDHGMAMMAARAELKLEGELTSDVAPVWSLVARALAVGGVTAMKDPTRGGLAAALNEMARKANVGIEIEGVVVPVRPEVRGLAELLGIDPWEVACEGRVVLGVRQEMAEAVVGALRTDSCGVDACVIGKVIDAYAGKVIVDTGIGGRRFLDMPLGDPVPRIC